MNTCFIDAEEVSLSVIRATLIESKPSRSILIYNLQPSEVFNLNDFITDLTPLQVGQELKEGLVILLDRKMSFTYDGRSLAVRREEYDPLERIFDEDEISSRENEAHYKYLFEISGELICTHEPSGVYKYVSPSALSILGFKPEELVGTDPYDHIHPDDIERIRRSSHDLIVQGLQPDNIQYRFRRKDGTYIWLDTYTNPVMNSMGRVTSLISGSREVTDLKETEMRLRQSEERFRGIADNLPGIIYLCLNDEKYTMLFLNEEVEYLTGYRAEDFLDGSISFVDLYHPDDADMIFAKVDRALMNQEAFHVTYRLKNRIKREYVWVDEYGQGIYEGKELKSIEGVILDSTERRMAEKNLRESEANLKAIFESTNSLICLFDREKRIIEFNSAYKNHVKSANGFEVEPGMYFADRLEGPLKKGFIENMHRGLSGEKFKATFQLDLPSESRHFLMSHNPVYQGDEVIGVGVFIEDISELKESQKQLEKHAEELEAVVADRTRELKVINEELSRGNKELATALEELKSTQTQLIQAEKMASLGVLAAGVGHEINNPLNFIQNGSSGLKRELLDFKGLDWEIIDPYFEIIAEGVSRAGNIVKSLSHFSRQVKDMDEPCNVHEVLDNCLVILNTKLKGRIEINRVYHDEEITITGNEGKLHQVFLNILTNAEQAIEHQGTISIRTRVNSDHVFIEIEDNGVGIPEENLSKIGDPFYTTKPPGLGTGLGLFITYSLVKELKGTIEVESMPKKGAKFIIRFPAT